jgi:hypothetical protein
MCSRWRYHQFYSDQWGGKDGKSKNNFEDGGRKEEYARLFRLPQV